MNLNLNFNQLRSFLLVAEEGNLTRAAGRRHTTPSAVSTQLQQLEENLGVELFERTRRGMNLTEAGERLLAPARRVMSATRDLSDAAARLNGDTNRIVRLGLNAPPEHLQVGPLMAASARGEPPLVIQLESSMSERICIDVAAGRLDAGFAYGEIKDETLAHKNLGRHRLRVAAPGNFELDRLPDEPAERAALPWIWPGVEGCPFRYLMPTILGTSEHEANIVTRIDGEESIRALVRTGMGVGLLEERYALEAAGDGRLKLLEQAWEIDLSLVHRADRAEDPVILALLSAVDVAWKEPERSVA